MKSFFRQGPAQQEDVEQNIQACTKDAQRAALLSDIAKTQCALEIAYSGFDNAVDPDLIDCYIYQVNSALKRYRYLLLQAEKIHNIPDEETETPSSSKTLFIPEMPTAYT